MRIHKPDHSLLDRRRFLEFAGGALGSALLAACDSEGPRAAQPLLRFAERKNEAVERALFSHSAIDVPKTSAKAAGDRFPAYFVSKHVPVWDEAARGAWRLEVTGMVERPLSLSLTQLAGLPRKGYRLDHFCVEGWSAVATRTGVQLSELAKLAGVPSGAHYVDFQSFDDNYHESWDIESAMHPQTLIVYAQDGQFLGPEYGAPARVYSPVKLGYKNTKYLTKIVFLPERNGGYWSDRGYEWYAGV